MWLNDNYSDNKKCIEHGNYLDDDSAVKMKEKGAYLSQTIITYQALLKDGEACGMPVEQVKKVDDLVTELRDPTAWPDSTASEVNDAINEVVTILASLTDAQWDTLELNDGVFMTS